MSNEIRTISGTTKVAHKEESWSINHGFVASAAVAKGAIVKLNPSTGEVEPVEAATDTPFGVITKGCNDANGGDVVVQTQYNGIYRGVASGSVSLGDELEAKSITAEGLTEYITATSNTVCAHALEDAEDGQNVLVGVLRVFN